MNRLEVQVRPAVVSHSWSVVLIGYKKWHTFPWLEDEISFLEGLFSVSGRVISIYGAFSMIVWYLGDHHIAACKCFVYRVIMFGIKCDGMCMLAYVVTTAVLCNTLHIDSYEIEINRY